MSTNQPREIAFEDIKVGDDITATRTASGVIVTCRGAVGSIGLGGVLHTAEGGYIGCSGDFTFTLNHRPTPTEPEGLGAVVRLRAGTEYVSTNRATGTPRWVCVNDNRGHESALAYGWGEFDPDSIEVLSEGNEVER